MRTVPLAGSVIVMLLLGSVHPVDALEPDVDYVKSHILVTFLESYMPTAVEVTLAPPAFGLTGLDNFLDESNVESLRKLTPDWDRATSAEAQRLERTFIVVLAPSLDAQSLIGEFEARPEFERVELDLIIRIEFSGTERFVPDIPPTRFDKQWNLDRDVYNSNHSNETSVVAHADIDAPEAWAVEMGDPGVVIGIIDTGTMLDTTGASTGAWIVHSDFRFLEFAQEDHRSPGVINGADFGCQFNFSDNNGDGVRDNIIGHGYLHGYGCGSAVHAGCPTCIETGFAYREAVFHGFPVDWILESLGANNNFQPISWNIVDYGTNGPHGVWVASIAAAKLTGADIVGVAPNCTVYPVRAIGGSIESTRPMIIETAQHCDVINMSWNFPGAGSQAFQDAIVEAANDSDCVLVGSAGNGGEAEHGVTPPARYPSVVAVGAIHKRGYLTSYSSWNRVGEQRVDLVAPVGEGAGVYVDSHSGRYGGPPIELQETTEYTNNGTSYAAPQVAGVAALIRSRFPGLNQADTRARLERSAQYYWEASPDTVRKYGKGKVNAYRAVTEWGDLAGAVTWTQNSLGPMQSPPGSWTSRPGSKDGAYYVSGDLTIKSGATLTIEPGVVVRVAPDHLGTGDATRVKIVVEDGGTLHIAGSEGSPVVFESFTDSPPGLNDWSGIEFQEGSSGSISHAVFRNAGRALGTYAPMLVYGVTIENGILGVEHFDDLTILNSQMHDLGGSGIMIRGGELTANNVEITDCGSYGITDGLEHGRVLIEDCTISDTGSHGIWLGQPLTPPTETIGIQGTRVERAGDTGILLGRSAAIVDCEVLESDIGIWLAGNSEQFTILDSSVDHNATIGVYVTGTVSATLTTTEVTNSVAGVFFDWSSSGLVHDVSVLTGNSVGLKADNNSNVTVRHTRITANSNGVAALNGATFDLGTATSGTGCGADGPDIGNNSIYSNTSYNVSNLSPGISISAEGNWWNSNPPKASKFYGNVDRDPWICSDPNPTAPSAGIDARPNEKPRAALPTEYSLGASQPNPFNPVTVMTFDVPPPGGDIEILIFDVKGTKVRTLVTGFHSSGVHSATWTGRSDSGEPIASGVYFARMNAPSFTQTRKLVLLK